MTRSKIETSSAFVGEIVCDIENVSNSILFIINALDEMQIREAVGLSQLLGTLNGELLGSIDNLHSVHQDLSE